MVDNVEADIGSGGATFATDEISNVHYTINKITYGPLDSQTLASSNAGNVDAGTQRVVLASDQPSVTVDNGGTFPVQMDGINGTVDANNSTTTPLGIGAVFTGTSTDILDFAGITVSLFADEASATDGLSVQFSNDQVNWDHTDVFTIPAGTGKTFSFQPVERYMRIVYTNGGTEQTEFRLSNIIKTIVGKPSSHRIADSISDQDDSQLVKAVITGENPGGTFSNVQTTSGGNLKISLEESNGDVTGPGVEATALRVTMATDSTGLLSVDDNGGSLTVDNNGTFATQISNANVTSTDNSTTSTLGSGASFVGTGEDVSKFAVVTIQLDASHNSAVDGMTFEFSSDDVNWDDMRPFTYTAADGARRFQFPVTAKFFRINYTNGGTTQTHFRVQTILHVNAGLTSIHRLFESVDPDRSATLGKSAIIAQAAGSGDFVPVQATGAGNLKMSVQEISDGLDIGAGNAGAETQRVSISTDDVNLSAINAGQLPDGHNVTVDNGAGASAINIQDGGNSITVDGTVTANAGTNLNTSALALETGGNLATVAGAVSGAEMQVDVVAPLPAGSNAIGKLAANSGVDIGDVDVTSISVGANLIGDVGLSGARTSGGTTLYKNIDVDESEDQVKATAGQIYWIHAINLTATVVFLKIYNATAASVTVGTTVPDLTFPVPANSTTGAGFILPIPNGIEFDTAITVAGTTGVADNDSGAPAANALVVNLGFA